MQKFIILKNQPFTRDELVAGLAEIDKPWSPKPGDYFRFPGNMEMLFLCVNPTRVTFLYANTDPSFRVAYVNLKNGELSRCNPDKNEFIPAEED